MKRGLFVCFLCVFVFFIFVRCGGGTVSTDEASTSSNESSTDTSASTSNLVDVDGDGYFTDTDCDDNNPHVHPDMTIQTALDNAQDGDTIYICDGTYQENIMIPNNMTLTIRNVSGESGTVTIEGVAFGSAVVTLGRAANVTLTGLIITGGINQNDNGGGIDAYHLSQGNIILQINNCVIENNSAEFGGGIAIDGTLSLSSTVIRNNYSTYAGGGLYVFFGADVTCTQSTFWSNQTGYDGGGIFFSHRNFTFESESCGWGEENSDNENLPNDISVKATGYFFGDNESFSCENNMNDC